MGTSAAIDSIAAQRDAFADAVRRGDAKAAATFYAADAHLLAPSAEPMVGRDEIRAFWQAGIDAGVADVSLTAAGAHQNGGFAYESGAYVFRLEPVEGARVVERGHYVQVYQCQPDGSWQRAVEIFSPRGGE
jgi:ketosteroid isomerase-like protein